MENDSTPPGDDMHPLLGQIRPPKPAEQEPVYDLGELPPSPGKPGSYIGRYFCDGCGLAGDEHMPDCPVVEARVAAEAMDAEDALVSSDDAEDDAVMPIARRLVATVLRKVARKIDGR